jgi:hypothetical protein
MPRPFEVAAPSKRHAGREIENGLKGEATSLAVQLLRSRTLREPFDSTSQNRWFSVWVLLPGMPPPR